MVGEIAVDLAEQLGHLAPQGTEAGRCRCTGNDVARVVVLGIVAARDLDAAAAQRAGSKVQHRRGHRAHIDHLDAGGHQAADQRLHQGRAAQPAITPHRHRLFTQGLGCRPKRQPQGLSHLGVEGRGHDAPDVVSLEDRCVHLHGWSPYGG